MKATLLVVLLLFLFACLVELWKGKNFQKVTLENSYWTRESQYDIGGGSTNETNNFTVFFIRNPLAGVGPHPDSLETTSALRREHEQEFSYIEFFIIVVVPSGVRFFPLDVVHAVIFGFSNEYCTTLYVV